MCQEDHDCRGGAGKAARHQVRHHPHHGKPRGAEQILGRGGAGEGNFSDESILGKASREVQEHLAGVWIHENAELAGITKGEIETIKAFASRQVDRARPAYGHYLVKQPRHSIEVGTTNAYKYMPSDTGNRRFWPIAVRAMIDLGKLRAARLQLWGEAAHYQSQGEALTLPEAMWADAGVIQEERRIIHPWEALLEELAGRDESVTDSMYFHRGAAIAYAVGDEWRVATVDLYKYIGVSTGVQHMGHAKTLASIMRKLGWTNKVFKIGEKAFNGYVRTAVMAKL
jgi:predicted P-loop ATPase